MATLATTAWPPLYPEISNVRPTFQSSSIRLADEHPRAAVAALPPPVKCKGPEHAG
jgi:hypothetical protein